MFRNALAAFMGSTHLHSKHSAKIWVFQIVQWGKEIASGTPSITYLPLTAYSP